MSDIRSPISERENTLRNLEWRNPLWIPCHANFAHATWRKYREDLEEVVLRHPVIWGGYKRGGTDFDRLGPHDKPGYSTDKWGCVWRNADAGMTGQVVGHPLADWKDLDNLRVPDPLLEGDEGYKESWDAIREGVHKAREAGNLTGGSGALFFDRLHFLRGFENLMVDFATDPPELCKLLDILLDYNMKTIVQWLSIGVDIMSFHGDMGTQDTTMISPAMFRKYIKPAFMKMFQTCRKAGTHVSYSSDGRLLAFVDDMAECGISMHDPQVRACTIDGISKAYRNKICARVDLDRQMFPFCSPSDIHDQVEETVRKVGSPRGGLELLGWIMPDVPLENIEAIAQAMEDFRTYWWDGRGAGASSGA